MPSNQGVCLSTVTGQPSILDVVSRVEVEVKKSIHYGIFEMTSEFNFETINSLMWF